MNIEETAQQLELAAQILRTGHPWEFKGIEEWHSVSKYPKARPEACIFHRQKIRSVLATPPDGRPLHNPDNLTAEQVGVGWRLTVSDEIATNKEYWHKTERRWYISSFYDETVTYRLPISVPWPEPQSDPCAKLKKTVPLGPEDVPPGSVLSLKPPRWFIISGISDNGIYVLDDEPLVENLWRWDYLMEKAQINRSIPLTGKWNPDAWEPCSKQVDA